MLVQVARMAAVYAADRKYPQRTGEVIADSETFKVAEAAIAMAGVSAAASLELARERVSVAGSMITHTYAEVQSAFARAQISAAASLESARERVSVAGSLREEASLEISKVAADGVKPTIEGVKVEASSGALRGVISGVTTPLVTAHLDAARHNSLMRSHDPEIKPISEVLKKDPLAPYRNGALGLSLLNNVVKFGVLNVAADSAQGVTSKMSDNPYFVEGGAGAIAGVAEAFATAPISYLSAQIKMGMSKGTPVTPMGILSNFMMPSLKAALASSEPVSVRTFLEGVEWSKVPKSLFTNMPLSMARNASYAATYFPAKRLLEDHVTVMAPGSSKAETMTKVAIGAIAGALSTAVAQPFANAADVGKSLKDRVSTREVVEKIIKKDGMAGLYKNLPASMLRMGVALGAAEGVISIISRASGSRGSDGIHTPVSEVFLGTSAAASD